MLWSGFELSGGWGCDSKHLDDVALDTRELIGVFVLRHVVDEIEVVPEGVRAIVEVGVALEGDARRVRVDRETVQRAQQAPATILT